jgi:hypothetical protein
MIGILDTIRVGRTFLRALSPPRCSRRQCVAGQGAAKEPSSGSRRPPNLGLSPTTLSVMKHSE